MYIEKINNPRDLKKLNKSELKKLSDEIRYYLIEKLSKNGGHIGPNLGVVELTIALHYVFNSPIDKIVFDVSHQCYTHKILTGRRQAFMDERHYKDVTGFTNPNESNHDIFMVGHTSTSISLALGLAKGRDLNNKKENIIAIIGDGSLSGGEALEALNYASEYKKNLIIIVNDNNQSIAENHGGLYKSLKDLRDSNGDSSNNIFKVLGLDYKYLNEGNSIDKLVEQFELIKNIDHPIVLHIHTIKGKGLSFAEIDRETWHVGGPFNKETGERKKVIIDTTVTDSLVNLLNNNKKAVLLNAATPYIVGFNKNIRSKYEENGQYIDVGIAEENEMGIASGIAKNGGVPVVCISAPFFQRTYDQLSSDICLNNSPVVILEMFGGVFGMTSSTHLGIFDIPLVLNIPNLVVLCPTSKEEYLAMFRYATNQKEHPILIRVSTKLSINGINDNTNYAIINKSKVIISGEDVAIIAVGNMLHLAKEIAYKYKKKMEKDITIINACYLSGVDTDLLDSLRDKHKLVITIEDSVINGGYGYQVSSYYSDSDMKVKNYGIQKDYPSDFKVEELLQKNNISIEAILNYIYKN